MTAGCFLVCRQITGGDMYVNLVRQLEKEHKENIVIYGKTDNIQEVFAELSIFPNVYVMDLEESHETGESNCLHTLEQVERKKIDSFVLLKQLISHIDIFESLMKYCKKYGADIYDLYGREVSRICRKAEDCAFSSKDQIFAEIDNHMCISFDIFDTLLQRKVLVPEDVFGITEKRAVAAGISIEGFKDKRKLAQQELGLTNPDIYDIYNNFHKIYGISEETLSVCRDIEIQVEKEVLVPRKDVLEIYKECLKRKKKVTLVTDMYLPVEIMEDILVQNGISGYDALYVSCNSKQLKLQGLLERYRKEIHGEGYLHIGDHRIYDGICAGLAEMDYCLVASGVEMARQTYLKKCIEIAETLEEHVMLGMVVARIMNSPFQEIGQQGELIVESDYQYGYCFCAVLLCCFVFWIYKKAQQNHYDDILFASRDGFLIQKMYKMFLERTGQHAVPAGRYFYTSRKAAVMTGINNEAQINMIINISDGMEPEKIMTERFGLQPEQVLEFREKEYGNSIHRYVWAHADKIFKCADDARRNYFKYMGNIGLQIGKKYAFMDFVSSGTCLKSLKRIVPFQMEGLYAGWNGADEREEIGALALYEGTDSYFMNTYKIMETFMTSDEPSLNRFDFRGEPVFMEQDRTEQELLYVEDMQNACLEFLDNFLSVMKEWEGKVSNCFADSIFAAGDNVRMADKNSVLNHLELMDDWKQEKSKIEKKVWKVSGDKESGADCIK